jgi:hypothetical protein
VKLVPGININYEAHLIGVPKKLARVHFFTTSYQFNWKGRWSPTYRTDRTVRAAAPDTVPEGVMIAPRLLDFFTYST